MRPFSPTLLYFPIPLPTALRIPPQPLTFRRMPRAPEESARSLPARSTKLILLTWVRGKRQEATGVGGGGRSKSGDHPARELGC